MSIKFVHADGEGFVAVKYQPSQNGSILVTLAAVIDRTKDGVTTHDEEITTISVLVQAASGETLQQIESTARERARLILEAAATAIA